MKICSVQVEYVVVFVFIVNAVGKYSCFRVERLSTRAGDVFEKNTPIMVDGSTMTISDCNVGGEGNGYWKNSTHCQCSYDETFVIDWDQRKAKCMEEYGEDRKDMGCKFHFSRINYVKNLNPTSASRDIGSVLYDGDLCSSFSLLKAEVWNIKWEVIPDVFVISSDGNLKWSSGNPTIVARRYAGTLIKLDLQAYRRGKKKESCLLLKMTGTRYYPLTFPVEQSSQGLVSTTTLQSSHYRLSSSESIPHSRNFQLTKTLSVTDTPKLSSIISQSSGASATTSAIERRSTQTVMTTPMSLTGVSQVKVTMSSSVHRMTTRSVSQPSVNPKTQSSSTEAPTSALRTPTSVLSTNSILRSYSSKFLPISSKISPSLAVMQSPSSFAKSLETSFLKLQTDTSYGEQNTVHTTKVPVHSMFLSSVGIQIPGVGAAAQKRSNKETVMIGATISAAIVFVFASIAVFILYRKKHLPKGKNRKRKETLKLGLTSNSFTNHSTNDGSIDGGSLKKNIGNPLYQDHLRLRTESANDRPPAAVYEDEYLVPSEPVYREIIEDGPIYSETGGIYQPIDENNVGLSESYQPLDSATLTRQNAPGCTTAHQAPIYHCLEEGYAPPKDAAQPPIYLTLEQESRQKPLLSEPVYQELECGHGSVNVVYEEEQV
ncbi:uncharacterized protein LOC135692513 [Rhopilema esculentum]|uniref:uncharacterized protein LOC135692513 n=1 Tax=Rhopilema esculentum TaxID=499914 RepID=UPI0031D27162